MIDKMRDDFFEWYYQQEQFIDAHQEELWKAWQASRAAHPVELPDSTGCGPAYHEAICDVTCSLDDAGVGYK